MLLIGYGLWAWRRKKATQAKFQDSVLGAAGGPGLNEPGMGAAAGAAAGAGASQVSVNQPVAISAGEVDRAEEYLRAGAQHLIIMSSDPFELDALARLVEAAR